VLDGLGSASISWSSLRMYASSAFAWPKGVFRPGNLTFKMGDEIEAHWNTPPSSFSDLDK
jgi:hypothetical protein